MERGYEFLRNVTNTIGNKIFQHLCYENNKKTIDIEKSSTLEEKVRTFLKRSDVTCKSKDEFGAYEVEICETVEEDEIYSDHFIKDKCYNFMPIITKKRELLFADNDNYLHHYSESRKCNNMVNENLLVYSTNKNNNDIQLKSGNVLLNVEKNIKKHCKAVPNNSTIIEELRKLETNA
ncbi:Hypothetical protein SRAE_X000179800 [Strongyloides ratti]|uniref:Uncharacterized protein n=1 Tax=Strongyloides ratti TaxID=34506 RepID=A0A090KXU2_STRRB|nr:Hypothetical protein SRAE_X000179800 [Strongyloides ratti]CEF60058.1 Hypothetical protein SRAE_X000179800 [Strongyloides ratti]